MKKLPFLAYVILILASTFIPYVIISFINWDLNIANWSIWWRVLLAIWALAITNSVYKKINNE